MIFLTPLHSGSRRVAALAADIVLLAIEAAGVWLLSGVLAAGPLSGAYARIWIAAVLAFGFLLLNGVVYALCVRVRHLAERKISTTRNRRLQGEYRYHSERKTRFAACMGPGGKLTHFEAGRQQWQFLMSFGEFAPDEWPPIK